MPLQLSSPAFSAGDYLPAKYTCEGDNINPPLTWRNVPVGTNSFVLIMDDPDVPTYLRPDGMFVHWLVWNIPPSTSGIGEGAEPPGVLGMNTARKLGYTGPCPPDREHRYFFQLYALDTQFDLPVTATKDEVLSTMNGHILDQAKLMGRFEKKESTMNPL